MKKKTRIIGSISALAISMAMLTCGVLAASQVSLDVTSNVSFEAKGVYVKVNGQIQKGASTGSLADAVDTTGTDYKYIGYSYDAVTEQTETGQTATTFDDTPVGTASNGAMTAWSIGTIEFDETNKVIRYNFTFTNYSEFPVNATIVNYSTADGSTPALTTALASFGEDVTAEESVEGGVIQIPALSDSTPGTATYTITLTLNNFSSSLSQPIALNFEFTEYFPSVTDYLEWVADDPGTTDVVDGYWTITMGEYEDPTTHEITPLVWRMVLKENEEGTDVESVANYTQNTTLSGSYYFLLDTYIENVFVCCFENNFTNSGSYPRLDEYENTVNVNDYAVSNIREYLTGTDVYRGYKRSGSDRIPAKATGQTEPENFLDVFNITSSPVYSMIEGRSLSELYSRMGGSTSGAAVTFDADVKDGVETKGVAGIDPDTTKDKLWLLSYYEASKITITQGTAADSGARSWDYYYWLRSPYSSGTYSVNYVNAFGYIGYTNNAYDTRCARPAFKISIS